MNYNKQSDESLRQYKVRLCRNKDIYGLTFQNIADLVNAESGDTKSESFYRRWWGGYREGYEDAEKEVISDDEVYARYEDTRIAAEKAKVRFFDQRTAYNKIVREEGRIDEFKDILYERLSLIKPYEPIVKYQTLNTDNDLLVGLNDIHFGANIKNHWNTYNSDIAKLRLEAYLQKIISIKNTHGSENCYVCANGDLISGNIHLPIQVSNKENIIEQVQGVSELISWFLSELGNNFKSVHFYSVAGNHSRISTKKDSTKGERLDMLIPWYLKARLSSFDNINIFDEHIDNTFSLLNIRGKNYLNVHGDYDSFSTANRVVDMLGEPIYCVHMGHLHHNKTDYIQRYKVIMSGSLCGMDDFCVEKRIYGVAQQLVCVCDSNGIDAQYDVNLQHAGDAM